MDGDDDTPMPPEVRLALVYAPARARPALAALFALDARLAAVRVRAPEPGLAMLRLAWWRDALTALDERPPPDEPLLRRIAAALVPPVRGGELATIAEGWMRLLEGEPEALASYASGRGGALFAIGARLLGGGGLTDARKAGEVWALVDLAGRSDTGATAALAMARDRVGIGRSACWPVAVRPLGMLASLAVADARGIRSGPSGRLFRMLAHRVTGRTGLGGMPEAA